MAKIIFDMPKGNEEFDEMEDGEKMSFSGTLRKEGRDKACLVSVDGKTLKGYSDTDDEEAEGEGDDMMGDKEPSMEEAISDEFN